MKPNQIEALLTEFIRKGCKVPLCFVGPKGVGKSWVVASVAKTLRDEGKDFGFMNIRLALDTPEDLAGYPRPREDSVYYLMADWAKETFDHESGIVFFDEINRSPLDTRQALLEVMTDFTIRRKPINKNWFMAYAMNPDNGKYQVQALDPAFERRMLRIAFEPDIKSWLSWSHKYGIDPSISEFLSNNANLLVVNEPIPIHVEPTPDSWRMLSDIIKLDCVPENLRHEVFSGLVGTEAAVAFQKFLKTACKHMEAEELFENFEGNLENFLRQPNDMLVASIDSVKKFLSKDSNVDKKISCNIPKLILALPKEMGLALLVAIPIEQHAKHLKVCENVKDWKKVEQTFRKLQSETFDDGKTS